MSITSVSNSAVLSYTSQQLQQTQQQTTTNTNTSIGSAAVVELSSTGSSGAAAISAAGGSSSGTSASNSCPQGKESCINCGQCGKKTSLEQSSNQTAASSQNAANYLTSTAINAYEMTSSNL